MTKSRPAIVIVAFNRPRSLQRLLGSLQRAYYPDNEIPLVISIDRGVDNKGVLDIAKDFDWQYGTKRVIYQETNLGLRNHVLKCGDLTNDFGAIIMLEDDLFLSPNFYYYSLQALEFSIGKPQIAGVSLYNHQLNVHNNKNFQPIEDGYDNWYFQFASSWGQAWDRRQWNEFRQWYGNRPSIDENKNIPRYVRSWSEKSWLKYFIAFLILKDRYFIYPKISLTTNFSDAGTHVGEDSTVFQLPLLYALNKDYHFSTLYESTAVYDAFYENVGLSKVLQLPEKELCIDLYGYKDKPNPNQLCFMLTTQKLNHRIIKKFGCSLKPIEANIFQDIAGDDIYLYDLRAEDRSHSKKEERYRKIVYNFKLITLGEALVVLSHLLKGKAKRALQKIIGSFLT
ncbi:MAG: family 2 glycosyl transferase [Muricauda sp.]|nr:glycosyltransferase [Allomuricauda sp.]MAU25989.1 family 2 glycosyl transferase [Allomuricauda sp.]MBC30821.1 family 2 glycosyl transferase [Allomuricauda sp.]|tara:strand:+ start:2293 stop:3480 length:1188 start_codon:yes stop_codon:yes gene_type:complete